MKLHKPVLLNETIELLDIKSGQVVVDMTAGYGGHSDKILQHIGSDGRLILVDRDIEAIKELKKKFGDNDNVEYVHSNFAKINWKKIGRVDRVLMDLGVSSPQLDRPERGFSFNKPALLDMRMDQSQNIDAKKIVNEYDEEDLANLIYSYGEETKSRKIAKAIVEYRLTKPITTTEQLAEIVSKVLPKKSKIHPATKTFQAIRIAVNDELTSLERALPEITAHLKPLGRLAVISFHSLEDRIVKHYFKSICEVAKDPVTGSEISSPNFRLVNKKPLKGSIEDSNPRARSAKLRIVEKIK
jgi:16S rRNA (cytosine1402-N4)-methyltransferase